MPLSVEEGQAGQRRRGEGEESAWCFISEMRHWLVFRKCMILFLLLNVFLYICPSLTGGCENGGTLYVRLGVAKRERRCHGMIYHKVCPNFYCCCYESGFVCLIDLSQLFKKANSRNIKLNSLVFNIQWLFGSILERTTKMIFLDTFCSQNLRFFSGDR